MMPLFRNLFPAPEISDHKAIASQSPRFRGDGNTFSRSITKKLGLTPLGGRKSNLKRKKSRINYETGDLSKPASIGRQMSEAVDLGRLHH